MLQLGQDAEILPIQVPPDQYASVATVWDSLYNSCLTMLPERDCQALLGTRPIYFPPEEYKKPIIPWWGFLIIGYLAGKYLI